MHDYYKTLNISDDATSAGIKKAYFSLVRQYPPERHPEEFMRIREAYETLIDQKTRGEYDEIRGMSEVVLFCFNEARKALEQGKPEQTINYLERIDRLYPHSSVIRVMMGEAYLKNGNSGKAISLYNKLVIEEPGNAGFERHLAEAYAMRGWNKKAVEQYRKALSLDEDNISLWLGLIKAYSNQNDFEGVLEAGREGLEVSNRRGWDNLELYLHVILADLLIGDNASMLIHLEEMKKKAAENEAEKETVAWFLSRLAEIISQAGLGEGAEAAIRAAVELVPEDKEIRVLEDEIVSKGAIKRQLEQLEEDSSVSPTLKEMLINEIDVCDQGCFDCTFIQLMDEVKMAFNESSRQHRIEIMRLKKRYPELFALKKKFFEQLLDPKKESFLRETYVKKIKKFIKQYPGRMAELEEFICEDDDYDEYDDDNEYEDYYDYDEYEETEKQEPYRRSEPKVGRNEPCPCKSGKKFKKCCGK